MISQVTPLILTYNEAPNIARTLGQLTWAGRVVVVDSFSTDETEAICRRFPQVEFVQRKFASFADQCNFGLTLVRTPWVLSLDADYVLTDELVAELRALKPEDVCAGFSARFTYCIGGRPLRSTLYPPRVVLYRAAGARYRNEGHGHRVEITGTTRALNGRILHDDRKSLDRWFGEQLKYSAQEARHLKETPRRALNRADRLRQWMVVAPFAVLFYLLFWRGLLLDGWAGWAYVFQRMLAELLLSLRLLELRLNPSRAGEGKPRGE